MQAKQQNTFMQKRTESPLKWFLIDAEGKTLGRLATEVANILRGKHKPDYTPHADTGDGVIIINAEKVAVSGNKEARKIYRRYTGHIGGLREANTRTIRERRPTYLIEHAVKGMVPRNRQGRAQMKRLRLFVGPEHTMEAQKPIKVSA